MTHDPLYSSWILHDKWRWKSRHSILCTWQWLHDYRNKLWSYKLKNMMPSLEKWRCVIFHLTWAPSKSRQMQIIVTIKFSANHGMLCSIPIENEWAVKFIFRCNTCMWWSIWTEHWHRKRTAIGAIVQPPHPPQKKKTKEIACFTSLIWFQYNSF